MSQCSGAARSREAAGQRTEPVWHKHLPTCTQLLRRSIPPAQDDFCFRPDPVYDFTPDYGWEVRSALLCLCIACCFWRVAGIQSLPLTTAGRCAAPCCASALRVHPGVLALPAALRYSLIAAGRWAACVTWTQPLACPARNRL